jgi:hypothetical protein
LEKETFYTSTNNEKNEALSKHAKAMSSVDPSQMAFGGFYSNVEDGISVRPPFTRKAWERFRPNERIPSKDIEIMTACREAYESVGVIRSVIDLMTEIAVEGIELVSENENIQNFFKQWSEKVNLKERAERFANYFVVEGNVVAGRKFESIDMPAVRRMKRDSVNAAIKSKIPLEYVFYDPQTISLIGGDLAIFSGVKKWAIKLGSKNIAHFRGLVKKEGESVLVNFPKEVKAAILNGKGNGDVLIPLSEDSVYVAHYKKKDSDIWAKSFIYSILHDVIYNEKLRMAKISALDSWYNSVRLWRLGDHKEEILPDLGSIVRLSNVLENHSGGTLDIIWDSMLSYDQYFPPIEKLENFTENYESMLLGLGVHKSLIGGDSSAGGSNDSFMGLRNLMKRIDGIRRAITDWINAEVSIICEELSFQNKPRIKFNVDNLFDQPSYFKLLTELNDRNVISNQTVVEKIGEMWDIEKSRLDAEEKLRKDSLVPEKLSPFIQTKISDSNHKKNKELINIKTESPPSSQNNKEPIKTNGRPNGSKDTVKRKVSKRIRAEHLDSATNFHNKIEDILEAFYLDKFKLSNKRQLNSSQKNEIDVAKDRVLAKFKGADLTAEEILEVSQSDSVEYQDFKIKLNKEIKKIKSPTVNSVKTLKNFIIANKLSKVYQIP